MRNIVYIVLVGVLFFACKSDDDMPSTQSKVVLESVVGRLSTPSNKAIPNARVFYDNDGRMYTTKTNQAGIFELRVPVGLGELHFQTGSGKLFRTTINISVVSGTVLDLTNENIILECQANLAFLAGSYDSIESIVTDLGYEIDEVSVTDIELGLADYDALFLNCSGNVNSFSSDFYQSLNDFMVNGKSMYVSDYALEYLVGYDAYAQNCTADRQGGFINDELVCGTRSGDIGWLNGNSIVNQDLNDFTSFTNFNIEYDLDIWMQLQQVNTNFWEVLVRDENQNPLMIKTNKVVGVNDDSVWYSENGKKVTICHIPPGNPENAHPITISVNALPAHIAHGCYVGSCDATSGNIYYTTFHNHIDGNTTPEITEIMEYMILNL